MKDVRSLVHSIYLDHEMLISFLAVYTDGVVLEQEVHTTAESGGEAKAKVTAGIKAKLLGLFGAEVSASLEGTATGNQSTVLQARRQFTYAALVNDLRELLAADGRLKPVFSPKQIEPQLIGQFVEVTGTLVGNPLEQLLRFYERVIPYVEEPKQRWQARLKAWWDRTRGRRARRQPIYITHRQVRRYVRRRNPREISSLSVIRSELDSAQVRDHVLIPDDAGRHPENPEHDGRFTVVLTLSRDYLSQTSEDQLANGTFTVLGKVTSVVLDGEEPLNLARRATIGLIGDDAVDALLTAYPVPHRESLNPLVEGPAIQILPVAIFA